MEDTAEYVMESIIRGHHVYNTIWEPRVGEQLALEREDSNSCDRYAVSVVVDHKSSLEHTGTSSDVVERSLVK